jgi:AcrR family transcriptional regulator
MGITERREREKEQRQNAIIDAAEEVFFSKGVENATMDEVAERAELSKGTLYLYFENKDDIYHAIVLRGLDILNGLFSKVYESEGKGIDRLNAFGEAYHGFHRKYPHYANALLHHEGHKIELNSKQELPFVRKCFESGNRIFEVMEKVVAEGIRDGSLRSDLDPRLLSIILWAHTNGIMQMLESKGEFFENIMGVKREDILEYSEKLMGGYLRPSG